jgi:hypothetical protein
MWREPSAASGLALERYRDRILALHEAPLPLAEGKQNELEPRVLPLSTEARRLWIGYADANEAQLGPGGALHPIAGLANKLPEHAARIAAVLALVDDLDADAVDGEHMAAGVQVAQHYASEALRLFEAGQLDKDLEDAEKLRRWLLESWEEPYNVVGLPEIYQRGPNSVRNARRARHLVKLLEEHGWLVKLPDTHPIDEVNGVKRREIWEIRRPR